MSKNLQASVRCKKNVDPFQRMVAVRTAFVARFIVLREARRSKAHREIEKMVWPEDTTAIELAEMFKKAFAVNGDSLRPVQRDLNRALEHADKSADYFLDQYVDRVTLSFKEALEDYRRSNELLFGGEDKVPRKGGWRVPKCESSQHEYRIPPYQTA